VSGVYRRQSIWDNKITAAELKIPAVFFLDEQLQVKISACCQRAMGSGFFPGIARAHRPEPVQLYGSALE
jgi:hypothetical protein